MKSNKTNNREVPNVIVDKSLNEFSKINFFPERLKKANELLRKSGLPKICN